MGEGGFPKADRARERGGMGGLGSAEGRAPRQVARWADLSGMAREVEELWLFGRMALARRCRLRRAHDSAAALPCRPPRRATHRLAGADARQGTSKSVADRRRD